MPKVQLQLSNCISFLFLLNFKTAPLKRKNNNNFKFELKNFGNEKQNNDVKSILNLIIFFYIFFKIYFKVDLN